MSTDATDTDSTPADPVTNVQPALTYELGVILHDWSLSLLCTRWITASNDQELENARRQYLYDVRMGLQGHDNTKLWSHTSVYSVRKNIVKDSNGYWSEEPMPAPTEIPVLPPSPHWNDGTGPGAQS